jgi:protein-S-isoprenylcysteine O-methyltransferase Ste14
MLTIQTVIYLSVLFFVSEFVLLLVKHSGRSQTKKKNERISLLLFWVTIPVSLSLGFFLAKYQLWNAANRWIALLGFMVFFMGILIRWISILQLRKEFTVDVAIVDNHQLKTDGIYKHLRHPSYLGLLLICFGLAIAMNSISSWVVIFVPVSLAIIYRMKTEESVLLQQFGVAYQNYRAQTDRIVPKIY